MSERTRPGGPEYDYVMAVSSVAELAAVNMRTVGRCFEMIAARAADLIELAGDSRDADDDRARRALRDEMIAMLRETAEISSHEFRLGIERFEAAMRPDVDPPDDVRRYKVKQ